MRAIRHHDGHGRTAGAVRPGDHHDAGSRAITA